ncbi:MAG: hypothetical protein JWO95_2990 [Verrucomicrobiales bacterium]|nr:hypothetical protein [Verrucomicrobiales bacterium]
MKTSNPGPEEFEKLRKVIALKRYEQPPPGYFNRLPNEIMARIAAGEGETKFWQRFIPNFTFRPAMAYGVGLAMCGAVALGVYYTSNLPVNNNGTVTASTMTTSQPTMLAPAPGPAIASQNSVSVNSTNPVMTEPSLFPNQVGAGLQTAPAGYTPHR